MSRVKQDREERGESGTVSTESEAENGTITASELLSPTEVAAKIKMSPRTLQKWRCNGRGPQYVRLGHAVRYREQDVDAWVESKLSRNSAEAADRR